MSEPYYTPKQLADRLQVSTTTLRRYEKLGLIPEIARTASNRRCYEEVHLQAFATIRALLKGYGIPVVYETMKNAKRGNVEEALWLLNREQYKIQEEKLRVEEIHSLIRNTDFSEYRRVKIKEFMTIGEVARIAGVNTSAIRHWEQEGLIASRRNKENRYRVFTPSELKKIIVISSLRQTVYFIENMRSLLNDLDHMQLPRLEKSFQVALQKLNSRLLSQFQGIATLMEYVALLDKGRVR